MTTAFDGSDLPVLDAIPALRDALAARGRAVLVAPPGAGKTTAVPLLLLDESWLGSGRIVMLEPRRLATRAAAARMAQLTGTSLGGLVGYQIRDERRIGPATRIEVVTEGVLTRRLQADPELPGVGLVIFDEVHERNVFTDLGMAFTLDVAAAIRPELRILAMSATLDKGRLSAYLGTTGDDAGDARASDRQGAERRWGPGAQPPGQYGAAPVIESEGRAHPVEIRWRPAAPPPSPRGRHHARAQRTFDVTDLVVERVLAAIHSDDGDVLVFLPGIAEIMRARAALVAGLGDRPIDVRPLAGALSRSEQDAALMPSPAGRRRIVLATDIAETSLTVEGVRVVVDSGLARTPRHDPNTGLTRLVTVSTSRDSAEQRAGRAGRTSPGVAYRLWSKIEHTSRLRQREPEILAVDPAGVVLELAAWGGTPRLLDTPARRPVEQATALLRDLGAVDAGGAITTAGRDMLGLPLHPRLARMVLDSPSTLACLLAALLDERDVLRGRSDELPVDVELRVRALLGERDDRADRRAVETVLQRARDVARRAGITFDLAGVDSTWSGETMLLAYPDRLAARRQEGQFQLRSGNAATIDRTDPMANEEFVIAADLDGHRTRSRIRRAAAVGGDVVAALLADGVVEDRRLVTDDDGGLVLEVERRLDGIRLGIERRRPEPGRDTTDALVALVRSSRLAALDWSDVARRFRRRVDFARSVLGDEWPDVGDEALLSSLDDWLRPRVTGAVDVSGVDMAEVVSSMLPWDLRRRLDDVAPSVLALPGERSVPIDYDGDAPTAEVRVQDLFGVTAHPTVANGRVPVRLQLLSPADRPIQITSDLPAFWSGSWAEVRKEMAGRYPKHRWPDDPAAAPPGRLKPR
ncbi:MAG: ATP-dependent helicase HrpB [Ilumatobacteraceae bacterium]